MKFKLFSTILLFSITSLVFSQNAHSVLDKASEAYRNAGGIAARFTLDTEDTLNKVTYSQDGTAKLLGNKFQLDLTDGTTWFDGTTQWVLVKDNNEVSITSPTAEELQGLSPSAMLNIYKTGFDLKLNGEQIIGGKTMIEVEMTPQASIKNKIDITKLILRVNKSDYIFSQITIYDKSGFNTTVSVRDLKTQQIFNNKTFQFSNIEYPSVEEIDLR